MLLCMSANVIIEFSEKTTWCCETVIKKFPNEISLTAVRFKPFASIFDLLVITLLIQQSKKFRVFYWFMF